MADTSRASRYPSGNSDRARQKQSRVGLLKAQGPAAAEAVWLQDTQKTKEEIAPTSNSGTSSNPKSDAVRLADSYKKYREYIHMMMTQMSDFIQ